MRCAECGQNNPNNIRSCPVCGTDAERTPVVEEPNGPWGMGTARPTATQTMGTDHIPPHTPEISGHRPFGTPRHIVFGARQSPSPFSGLHPPIVDVRLEGADVNGHVISIEQQYTEKPDLDVFRALNKTLWLTLAVIAPFLLIHFVMVKLGAFSAILTVIGFLFLLRLISPTNLFTLFHLSTMLNPLGNNRHEQTQVRYFRIRDRQDAERMVRIKGILIQGNVALDDIVSLWGNWRGGSLHVTRGYNHRTHSWIRLKRSYSWIFTIVSIIIIGILVGYFYGSTAALMDSVNTLGG